MSMLPPQDGQSTLALTLRTPELTRIRAKAIQCAYPVALIVAAFLLWEYLVRLLAVPGYLLPAPSIILQSFISNWYIIHLNLWPTVTEVLIGYLMSILIGVPLAILIVYSRFAEQAIYPPMVASQAIPKVAVAPLFIVWMGYGIMPKVWIAFLIAFFPIVIDTVVGLRAIQLEMLYLGRSMGAGTLRVFLKLRLPNALPNLFGGLKVAISLAVVGAITGEFVGSEKGLGYLLTSATGNMDTPLVFAILFVVSGVAVVLFVLVEILERIAIPWHASMRSRHS
jgi:NitT/TauT family transport system permease protein